MFVWGDYNIMLNVLCCGKSFSKFWWMYILLDMNQLVILMFHGIQHFGCILCANVPVDGALDSRSEGLRFDSQCWPCAEVSGKLRIPHCLGPPSHNWYLVHRSKVGSSVAGCIGAHLARGKVKSVEHALSWSLDSKQLPLPLPF